MATRPLPPEQTEPLTAKKTWKALEAHWKKVQGQHLRMLFAKDPGRGKRLTAEAVGLFLDYSKNRITEETLDLLIRLAEQDSSTNNLIRHYRKLRGTVQ